MPSSTPTASSATSPFESIQLQEYEILLEEKLIPLYEAKLKLLKNKQNQVQEYNVLYLKIQDLLQHIYLQENEHSNIDSNCLISNSTLPSTVSSTSKLSSPSSSSSSDYKTLINVGENYYVSGIIPQPSLNSTTIAIDIGCNIYIDMNLSEAIQYIQTKLHELQISIPVLQEEIIKLGSDIQLATAGVETIQEQKQQEQLSKSKQQQTNKSRK